MTNFDKIYIATILKNARKQANLKQSELAELTGISEKHLSKIETGKNYPSLDNFLKMIEVLNISLDDLGISTTKIDSNKKEELIKIINTSTQKQVEAYLDIIKSTRKHII